MIAVVVVFLAAGAPVTALRSREAFATMAECQVALETQAARFADVAAMLGARFGTDVSFEAGCLDLTPGASA